MNGGRSLDDNDRKVDNCGNARGKQIAVERNGSGLELRILDYENPGSIRILCCGVKTLGKLLHSTLLHFSQLYK